MTIRAHLRQSCLCAAFAAVAGVSAAQTKTPDPAASLDAIVGGAERALREGEPQIAESRYRDALYQGKNTSQQLQLLIENTDYFRTFVLDYHGGEKYPHLVREESKPDTMTEIIRAH